MNFRFRPVFLSVFILFCIKTSVAQAGKQPSPVKPAITIVTDGTWNVSGNQTKFGEYPLSAEMIASETSPLYGGTHTAAAANYNPVAKVVPGSTPIWRNRVAEGEMEAYQFRKTVQLGIEPIQKVTLEINSDDVARVYINKRLVSAENRDGTIKDGYDDWYTFRSVSGFTYNRLYTYDVTDYFFTNVTNTILIEAVSMAFDGSHAYISAKVVIEFGPMPEPKVAAAPKRKTAAVKPQQQTSAPKPNAATTTTVKPAVPEKIIFEAGHDPEIARLQVGSILELGHVQFKADDYHPDSSSYKTLAALAAFMNRHPGLKIEVGGHTNLRASERFANELSTNRARAVMQYLTDNGVAANRLTFKGYGKTQPRINTLSEAADKANQRVEVKVVEQ